MKKVKSKIVIGVLAVGLVGSLGTAFAAVDVGGQLKNWYDKQFSASTASIVTETAKYGNEQKAITDNELNKLKNQVSDRVKQAGTEEANRAVASLTAAKNDYLNALRGKTNEIKGNMQNQYNQNVEGIKQEINKAANHTKVNSIIDLTNKVNHAGEAGKQEIKTNVTSAQDKAKQELTGAINDAKNTITALIREKEASSKEETKRFIDEKVAEIQKVVDESAKLLEKQVKDAIKDTGVKAEQEAKNSLDQLVADQFK
ncbi:hypothetical protein EEL32_15620 [Brevibacillus laterosporus]|uniref:Uncharacterized protein n=1 Tax=Brevibacillus laterosporus TaxID=1465 RepID=A0A502H827_BRELA|nr:hypothetical protein [Brevibacillus laterosporus]QDX92332.1 hypothetical protein EEL30_08225 [Brevibacillus laterosporus]TPG70641.1 hypothetical protein EEL31_20690 [Brevibacillus laterosporus]TPG84884.1 hypothetical protein EEL32_15620 [Brevibacillus laterosporus]